jgi:nitrogen regulatory protein PII
MRLPSLCLRGIARTSPWRAIDAVDQSNHSTHKVAEVKGALQKLGMSGLAVTEVRGHGKQKGHAAIYRGREYEISLLPKMELEIVVTDALLNDAVHAMIAAAQTGQIGDGRVLVTPVLESYKIRTGLRED